MFFQVIFAPQSLNTSLAKLCRFPFLKLYQHLEVFKLTKGTPHTGLSVDESVVDITLLHQLSNNIVPAESSTQQQVNLAIRFSPNPYARSPWLTGSSGRPRGCPGKAAAQPLGRSKKRDPDRLGTIHYKLGFAVQEAGKKYKIVTRRGFTP